MSKKGGSDKEAKKARKAEEKRQAEIRAGTTRINSIFDGQFNDGFFDTQQQNYAGYATPQLEKQYGDAQKELTFSLARSGNLDSSTRGQQAADLQSLYDINKQKVADDALAYGTQSRTQVEQARAELIANLNATGDATQAANSALSRSSTLSAPQAYSPLSNLFTSFTSGLGMQAAAEKSAYLNGTSPTYNTGLFAPSANLVKNSR